MATSFARAPRATTEYVRPGGSPPMRKRPSAPVDAWNPSLADGSDSTSTRTFAAAAPRVSSTTPSIVPPATSLRHDRHSLRELLAALQGARHHVAILHGLP